MNEQGTAVSPSATPLLIAAVLLALGAAAYLLLFRAKAGSSGNPNEFRDPAQITELEIKGVRPDGTTSWSGTAVPEKPELNEALAAKGKDLFAKACAACHGSSGKGDGPAPKRFDFSSLPADLTQPNQTVKLRTTLMDSPPTEEDLFRTLTRGLPGTPMWSFRNLPEADRWALIAYLKTLSQAYEKPGEVVPIPARLPRSPAVLSAGKEVYANICLNCHGADGFGPVVPLRDPRTGNVYPGVPWARNGGTEMLSGNSEDDIARTLMVGLDSRSPMRSFKLFFYISPHPSQSEKDEGDRKLWGTVYYVKDLLDKAKK